MTDREIQDMADTINAQNALAEIVRREEKEAQKQVQDREDYKFEQAFFDQG